MDVPRTINLSAKKFTTKVPPIRKYIKVASGLNPCESKKLDHVLNVTVQMNNPPEVAEAVENGGTAYMSQQDGQNVIEGNSLAWIFCLTCHKTVVFVSHAVFMPYFNKSFQFQAKKMSPE